ncbi:UL16-binding protein 1-like [Talpa occidentalis]|uniref:UL16-binding protein 1-like n=1 Tax=Talpa occidentalis TaxID=50954 RepID=UPI00188EC82B|nr:UL16-binding protein 1-like [Talpa occidentalis]XP_037380327.1 UL16-binding protein 1-like [Talpa occidentalis]
MAAFVPRVGVRVLLLLLLLLRGGAWGALGAVQRLCYNFSVTPRPGPGRPWCEIRGQVEGSLFLHYRCGGQEVKPVFPLGTKEDATEAWEGQTESLKDLMEELKKKLLDPQPGMVRSSGPLSLQGRMVCEGEARGQSRASWRFVVNGHISLRLDSETRLWTGDPPADTGKLERWAEDRDLNHLLLKMSLGDCKMWLRQVAAHWEMPGTTASPAMAPGKDPPKATTVGHMPWLIPVILLPCAILLGIVFILKARAAARAPEPGVLL